MDSYYDVGVAMVDCVIVISVYTLHVWGPSLVEVQLFIVHWVIKRRQQNNLLLYMQDWKVVIVILLQSIAVNNVAT